jgi:hypothetical protein
LGAQTPNFGRIFKHTLKGLGEGVRGRG